MPSGQGFMTVQTPSVPSAILPNSPEACPVHARFIFREATTVCGLHHTNTPVLVEDMLARRPLDRPLFVEALAAHTAFHGQDASTWLSSMDEIDLSHMLDEMVESS